MKLIWWFLGGFGHILRDDPQAMYQLGAIESEAVGMNFLFGARRIAQDTGGMPETVVASIWECPYRGGIDRRMMQRNRWWHVGYAVKLVDDQLYGLFFLN